MQWRIADAAPGTTPTKDSSKSWLARHRLVQDTTNTMQ